MIRKCILTANEAKHVLPKSYVRRRGERNASVHPPASGGARLGTHRHCRTSRATPSIAVSRQRHRTKQLRRAHYTPFFLLLQPTTSYTTHKLRSIKPSPQRRHRQQAYLAPYLRSASGMGIDRPGTIATKKMRRKVRP